MSIRRLAELTGYSPTTISNALNHKKGVNKQTAAFILQTARDQGYVNQSDITKIKLIMYKESGLIVEDTPFFSLVIDGFEKECRWCGLEMSMCYLDHRQKGYENELKSLLMDTTAGVVLLGSEISDEEIRQFNRLKAPFLTLEYWANDMSYDGVFINNADSASLAAEYLIQKGHRKIGYIAGDFRINAFRERRDGLENGLKKHGLSLEERYVVILPPTMEDSYKGMMEYLKSGPSLPTAYFADNDMLALGAMKALQERGIQVPEEVSMIGFDDLPFCEISSPRLTSLRVPKQEMGQEAARRMIEMIRTSSRTKAKIQICTALIERDSVKELILRA